MSVPQPKPGSTIRYQLCVVARDVAELVDLTGGWICDRIFAGWDVSVALSEPCDVRPLQILGVTLVTPQRLRLISDDNGSYSAQRASFVIGTDVLVDGGVTASLHAAW